MISTFPPAQWELAKPKRPDVPEPTTPPLYDDRGTRFQNTRNAPPSDDAGDVARTGEDDEAHDAERTAFLESHLADRLTRDPEQPAQPNRRRY